jgi:short-subunit dehydrogenase
MKRRLERRSLLLEHPQVCLVFCELFQFFSLQKLRCAVFHNTTGIGRSTCVVLAKAGAQVCGVGRSEEALQQLQTEIGCKYIAADLLEEGKCAEVVQLAAQQLGGLVRP